MTLLKIRQLTKRFGGLTAVDKLDFQVEQGQSRAIIGPNGAGKSTLLSLIMGELQPDRGEIYLADQRIDGLRAHRVARCGISKACQSPQLFPGLSAFENIVAAMRGGSAGLGIRRSGRTQLRERSDAILRQMGLFHLATKQAADLAHGDQKRLEIGIVLAQAPRLLLLDEPTAGLSHAETDDIVRLIRSLRGKMTLVMVEHDMRVVMTLADTISVLHHGRLLAEGTPQQIKTNPRVQEVYLKKEAD